MDFRKKSVKRAAAVITAAVVLLAALGLYLNASFAAVGSGSGIVISKRNVTELDLSGSGLTSLEGIERLNKLETLDIRGLEIDIAEFTRVSEALPECEILWDIPLSTGRVSCSEKNVVLETASAEDIELLNMLRAPESVDFGSCELYDEMTAYAASVPECTVVYRVKIGNNEYLSDTAELTARDLDSDELQKLKYLPALKKADIRGCTDYDGILSMKEQMPECEFLYNYEFFGKTVNSDVTVIDISNKRIKDVEEFAGNLERAAKLLPSLSKVDMCYCGLSDEQMASLCERFPNIKFVWMIKFGPVNHRYEIRTDVTCFSTFLPRDRVYAADEKAYEPLFRYCTDLVALDMGHNALEDISLISNLKKLKYLIITDNHITDLSPLTACPDLVFLEANKNRVTDVSYMPKLKNLKYVTLHYNKISDITPFYEMKNLKILILSENFRVPAAQKREIVKELPDCSIYFTLPYGTGTGKEWDSLPERIAVKEAFSKWSHIEEFVDWDDIRWK